MYNDSLVYDLNKNFAIITIDGCKKMIIENVLEEKEVCTVYVPNFLSKRIKIYWFRILLWKLCKTVKSKTTLDICTEVQDENEEIGRAKPPTLSMSMTELMILKSRLPTPEGQR